jgi:hypothetical protein
MYMQTSNEMFLNWIKYGMSLKVYVQCTCLYIVHYVKFRNEDNFFIASLSGENPRLVGPSKRPNQMGLKVGPHLELKQS